MTQTVAATAQLGPGKTGLAIGYRVLDIARVQYSAFTTTNVAETGTAGTYSVAGGVVCPNAGGYIVWGTALVDYAEATVESTSANVTYWAGVAATAGAIPAAVAGATGGVAIVGSEMGLADSAITSAKFASGAITAAAIAADAIGSSELAATAAAEIAAAVIAGGAGTYSYSDTVDDGSGNLLDGVFIQLSTNSGFTNIVMTTYTNALGAFTVYSDTAGTHYLRLQLAGYIFADQTVTLA